jgi:predicted kinase
MKTLYIIRGIPGSGKSTLAAKMAAEKGISYYETDQFMTEPDGTYLWTQDRLSRAIDLCSQAVYAEMDKGNSVIVTGVYTRWRAIRDYVETAQKEGYNIEIITCQGDYGSVHNVPADKMELTRQRFIPNTGLPQMQGIKYVTYP